MAPRTQVPSSALFGKKLTAPILDGAMRGTNVTMYALPMAVPLGYGKKWVEGFADDPGVQDQVEQEYGAEYKDWVRAVCSALDNQASIAPVYQRMKEADALGEYLGPNVREDQLHLGEPKVPISFLMATLHPQDFEERKKFLGPYKATPEATGPGDATPGTALSETAVDRLVRAMSTKEDCREAEKLKD